MCLSAAWIEHFLIQLVIFCVIIGVLRLLVPWVLAQVGMNVSVVMQIINLIIIGMIIIAVIYLVFTLLNCMGGFHITMLIPSILHAIV